MRQELPPLRTFFRQESGWLIGVAAVTLAVIVGVYALGRWGGVGERNATVAAMVAAAVWLAVAGPALAASSGEFVRQLLRAGTAADGALLALWAIVAASRGDGTLTFWGACKVYVTLAAMAVAAVCVVRLARGLWARQAAALACSAVMLALLATPLWTGGLIAATSAARQDNANHWRDRVTTAAAWANPVYAVAAATAGELHYAPHQSDYIYTAELTLIGDYATPTPTPWPAAAIGLAGVSGACMVIRAVRRKPLVSHARPFAESRLVVP